MIRRRVVTGWLALIVVGAIVLAISSVINPAQAAPASQPVAQPATAKQSVAISLSGKIPQTQGLGRSQIVAPAAAYPNAVLYSQYDNASSGDVSSQDFDSAFQQYEDQAADDFPITSSQNWSITEVDAAGQNTGNAPTAFNIYFYTSVVSGAVTIPGSPVYSATNQAATQPTTGNYVIPLTVPAVLSGNSSYFLSVQARLNYSGGGQWYWQNRSVQASSPASWRNPGNGFGSGCTVWSEKLVCVPTEAGTDQIFTLQGMIIGSATNTPLPTNTPTTAPTHTQSPSSTPQPTHTPGGPTDTPVTITATPTTCANVFTDITGNLFYTAIHYLNCRAVINGTDATHYSPAVTSTRGQFAKVIVLGFGIVSYTPMGTPDFSDVPASYFAYLYIESGYHAAILSGFDRASCQAAGQPYPCYLPNRPITRGQLTKLVVNATHYPLYTPTSGPTFTDVPASNVFYASIETAAHKMVVSGYSDHTFRPNNNIRRDEMAQIVYKAVITP